MGTEEIPVKSNVPPLRMPSPPPVKTRSDKNAGTENL